MTGGVKGYKGYVKNGNELLKNECDILIPAALEGVINKIMLEILKLRL